jgi:signal transduction histidine kinase
MRKLRIRIIVYMGAAMILGLGVYSLIGIRAHNAQLLEERIITLNAASQIVSQNVYRSMARGQPRDIQAIVRDMATSTRIQSVRILDESGVAHFSASPHEVGKPARTGGRPFASPSMAHGISEAPPGADLRLISNPPGRSLVLTTPIRNQESCHRCHGPDRPVLGSLEMVFTIADIDAKVARNRDRAFIFGAFTFLLVIGAATFIVQRTVRPAINRLIEGTRRIHSGEYGYSIPVGDKDELGWLAQYFNMMSMRLKKRKEEDLREWKMEMEQRIRDATARLEQVNAELNKALEDLQKTEKVKSDLALVIYHDLRSPLAAVQSCMSVVLEEILGELNPRQKDMLRRADEDIDKLLAFISDLLELSKVEKRTAEGRLQPTQLAGILRTLLTSFAARIDRRNLSLTVNVPDELPLIYADAGHMEQVFRNIIGNAIKYTPPGGAVSVTAGDDGENVIVTVKDTGIGIPEEDLPKIFDVFHRAPNAIALEKVGTGLGLSIVTRIVKDHAGEIKVRSRENHGSEFAVTFPIGKTPTIPEKYQSE